MPLLSRLQPALADRYDLEREIGRGGMATVFLAKDLRHHRRVAVKVLDPELGAVLGAERFLSEIRVTANLQHPNLLPLFDSGEADGLLFYVMPFVEGESLRARLDREQQLPIDEVVKLGVAVASALDYAHRHGVIHRDLKPENILLHDGAPLVADFGIALAVTNAGGQRVTQTGLSLGTPQYMSPEQATGDRHIDGRTDIYSLGAVLYEALGGEPPHTGQTAQAVIARLMTEEPRPLTVLRKTVPLHVESAIRRALQKLPADRFATAKEFADALEGRGAPASTLDGFAAPARSPNRVMRILSSPVWAAVALAGAAGGIWFATRPAPPRQVSRFVLNLDDRERLAGAPGQNIAIAPDGSKIVYVGWAGNGRLFIRPLDELHPREIPGTEGARNPVFSPDGKWIAFVANSRLRKVSSSGGVPVDIAQTEIASLAPVPAWTPDGAIIISATTSQRFPSAGLLLIPPGGGVPRLLTKKESNTDHAFPIVAPDGKTIVFTVARGRIATVAQTFIAFGSMDGSYTVTDVPAAHPVAVVDKWLVFERVDGALMGAAIDLANRKVTGEPIPLIESAAQAVLSPSGTLVYSSATQATTVALVDDHGAATPLIAERRLYGDPRYSPDGKRIAMDIGTADGGRSVWIYDVASTTMTRLTGAGLSLRPEWTPDGSRVLYRQVTPGKGLWWQPADGSGKPEQVIEAPGGPNEGVVSPDGKTLIYRTDRGQGPQEVFAMRLDGTKQTTELLSTSVNWAPRLSPDGHWLAYSSDESGRSEIYVRAFPGQGGRVQVSNQGGEEPIWSRDGHQLFYRNGAALEAATVSTSPGFTITARHVLFSGPFENSGPHANYDVAPDGKHFVMVTPADDQGSVVVVLNWTSELRARMAAK